MDHSHDGRHIDSFLARNDSFTVYSRKERHAESLTLQQPQKDEQGHIMHPQTTNRSVHHNSRRQQSITRLVSRIDSAFYVSNKETHSKFQQPCPLKKKTKTLKWKMLARLQLRYVRCFTIYTKDRRRSSLFSHTYEILPRSSSSLLLFSRRNQLPLKPLLASKSKNGML